MMAQVRQSPSSTRVNALLQRNRSRLNGHSSNIAQRNSQAPHDTEEVPNVASVDFVSLENIAQLKSELEARTKQIESLKASNEACQLELDDVNDCNSKLSADAEAARSENTRLKHEVDEASAAKQIEEKSVAEAEQEIEKLQKELSSLREKQEKLRHDTEQIETHLSEKLKKIESTSKEQKASVDKDIANTKSSIEFLQAEVRELNGQLSSATAVSAEIMRLKQELVRHNAWSTHKELFRVVKEAGNEQRRLRDILEHVRQTCSSSQRELQDATSQRNKLYKQLSTLVQAAQGACEDRDQQKLKAFERLETAIDSVAPTTSNSASTTAVASPTTSTASDVFSTQKSPGEVADLKDFDTDTAQHLQTLGGLISALSGEVSSEILRMHISSPGSP